MIAFFWIFYLVILTVLLILGVEFGTVFILGLLIPSGILIRKYLNKKKKNEAQFDIFDPFYISKASTEAVNKKYGFPPLKTYTPIEEDYNSDINPYEYEHYCARLLENKGWKIRVTKASGDQGADIIAEKNGKLVVLQCKKYSKPVGNKAVQEVHAAKGFNNATAAIVVSNSSFTKAAKELAEALNIKLLDHTDLKRIDEII